MVRSIPPTSVSLYTEAAVVVGGRLNCFNHMLRSLFAMDAGWSLARMTSSTSMGTMGATPDLFEVLNKSEMFTPSSRIVPQTECLQLIMNSAEQNPGATTHSMDYNELPQPSKKNHLAYSVHLYHPDQRSILQLLCVFCFKLVSQTDNLSVYVCIIYTAFHISFPGK